MSDFRFDVIYLPLASTEEPTTFSQTTSFASALEEVVGRIPYVTITDDGTERDTLEPCSVVPPALARFGVIQAWTVRQGEQRIELIGIKAHVDSPVLPTIPTIDHQSEPTQAFAEVKSLSKEDLIAMLKGAGQ